MSACLFTGWLCDCASKSVEKVTEDEEIFDMQKEEAEEHDDKKNVKEFIRKNIRDETLLIQRNRK